MCQVALPHRSLSVHNKRHEELYNIQFSITTKQGETTDYVNRR